MAETRVAVIAIIVEEGASTDQLNQLLHEAAPYIVGRMGIPYRKRGVNIISVAIDAPQDVISALAGRIGRLEGVSTKTAYSNVVTPASDEPAAGAGSAAGAGRAAASAGPAERA